MHVVGRVPDRPPPHRRVITARRQPDPVHVLGSDVSPPTVRQHPVDLRGADRHVVDWLGFSPDAAGEDRGVEQRRETAQVEPTVRSPEWLKRIEILIAGDETDVGVVACQTPLPSLALQEQVAEQPPEARPTPADLPDHCRLVLPSTPQAVSRGDGTARR